jgi:hypothetical protein
VTCTGNNISFKPNCIAEEVQLPVEVQVHFFKGVGCGVVFKGFNITVDYMDTGLRKGKGRTQQKKYAEKNNALDVHSSPQVF